MTDIRFFDPHAATRAEWAAYHAFRRRRMHEVDPTEPIDADDSIEHELRQDQPLNRNERHVVWQDGAIAATLGLGLRREGTPNHEAYAPLIWVWGSVLDRCRRQGLGTALARTLLQVMTALDKSLASCSTHDPGAHAFLAALGATPRLRSVQNRMPMAGIDWSLMAAWHRTPEPLRWEVHAGRVPLDRFEALLPQINALLGDVPLGTLDVPRPRFEMAWISNYYAEMDRRGGDDILVLLMDGPRIAALSQAHWNAHEPDRAYQDLTAVAPAWRGRGLAKAVKAALLQLVRERRPEVSLVITGNAETNAPMLSINDRLGFEVYRQHVAYQLPRDSLAAWLADRPWLPVTAGIATVPAWTTRPPAHEPD